MTSFEDSHHRFDISWDKAGVPVCRFGTVATQWKPNYKLHSMWTGPNFEGGCLGVAQQHIDLAKSS